MSLFPRFATQRVHTVLSDTPAVLINGPRQCGKTTLALQFASETRPYLTLDDEAVLAAAQADAAGLLRGLDGAVIDEVQRSPHLLRALKLAIGIVQRDIRDLAEVSRLDAMPRLLRALAAHAGQLANFSQLGGQLGLDDKTCRRYLGLLEQVFLVRRLEPWHRNDLKRLVKTPKLQFTDPGLLAALLGLTAERLWAAPLGSLLGNAPLPYATKP